MKSLIVKVISKEKISGSAGHFNLSEHCLFPMNTKKSDAYKCSTSLDCRLGERAMSQPPLKSQSKEVSVLGEGNMV